VTGSPGRDLFPSIRKKGSTKGAEKGSCIACGQLLDANARNARKKMALLYVDFRLEAIKWGHRKFLVYVAPSPLCDKAYSTCLRHQNHHVALSTFRGDNQKLKAP
jgi:hypothetical protein